jgi:hypothetical protein
VLNPLDKSAAMTISNGNLNILYTAGSETRIRGTMQIPSTGKWYFDFTCGASFAGYVGIASASAPLNSTGAQSYGWNESGRFYINGTFSTTPFPSFTAGDVLGVEVDTTANTILFYKNGVAVPAGAQSISSGFAYFPFALLAIGSYSANFGQQPWAYTPPTGFLSLNTFNLPDSTIVKGNTVMDATLYTGTGANLTVTNAGAFKPDLVWAKSRSNAYYHHLVDSVRGVNRDLNSNDTLAEFNYSSGGSVTAFNSNGFSLGTQANEINTNAATFVAWQWQAGQGSSSSNTNGTITSTVSVNASAGFSVVTYTGTGANATVGHGLGVAPAMVITKSRSGISDWNTYHAYANASPATGLVFLNSTSGFTSFATAWNNIAPTSSTFSLGTYGGVNTNGNTYVAYCWTPIAGYSAFGSYTGNSSADGPFIYCGFRPKFIMIKGFSFAIDWYILDSATNTYNVAGAGLRPNLSASEVATSTTENAIDFLSNGFKIRNNAAGVGYTNSSGQSYMYAAWAENPFKNSLAR